MFGIYFIKTMILILTYVAYGITFPVLVLYIHQIYTYLKSEKQLEHKDENYGVKRAAKILVFTISVLIHIGCIAVIVITIPWCVELVRGIQNLIMTQPAYLLLFVSTIVFLFFQISKMAREILN